jgi:hypothetical protein
LLGDVRFAAGGGLEPEEGIGVRGSRVGSRNCGLRIADCGLRSLTSAA